MENEELRNRVIDEIISTEETYVESIHSLVQNYLKPLKELTILSEKEIHFIFSNIEIINNLNTELLKQLVDRKSNSSGDEPMFNRRYICSNGSNASNVQRLLPKF